MGGELAIAYWMIAPWRTSLPVRRLAGGGIALAIWGFLCHWATPDSPGYLFAHHLWALSIGTTLLVTALVVGVKRVVGGPTEAAT
jgi:hypothetical protein